MKRECIPTYYSSGILAVLLLACSTTPPKVAPVELPPEGESEILNPEPAKSLQKKTALRTGIDSNNWADPCSALYEGQAPLPDIQKADPARSFSDLLVGLYESTVVQLVFDKEKGEYQATATEIKADRHASTLTVLGESIFTVLNSDDYEPPPCTRVLKLNKQTLKVEQQVCLEGDGKISKRHSPHGSIGTDGKYVYVSGQGDLIVLTQDLKELGRVGLFVGPNNQKKNAHDIIFHDGVAYLLDNVVRPIYTFRVDVSKPQKPVVIQRHDGFGVNPHLEEQWIVENPPMWIYKTVFWRSERSQWFSQKCLSGKDTPLTDGKCLGQEPGLMIDAVVKTEVPLALLYERKSGTTSLGRGKYSAQLGFHFEKLAKIGSDLRFEHATYKDGFVYAIGNQVTGRRERHPVLMVIDVTQEQPLLVYSTDLRPILKPKVSKKEVEVLFPFDMLALEQGDETGSSYPLVSLSESEEKVRSCIDPVPTIVPPVLAEEYFCENESWRDGKKAGACHEKLEACEKVAMLIYDPDTDRHERKCNHHTKGYCLRAVNNKRDVIVCFDSLNSCQEKWHHLFLNYDFSDCVALNGAH